MLALFMALWDVLEPFGMFYCHLVYSIPFFGMLYREKSGTLSGVRRY
jgi:hypothetical protein